MTRNASDPENGKVAFSVTENVTLNATSRRDSLRGAKPIGKRAMTGAQREKRRREGLKPNSTRSKQRRRAEREAALAEATRKASTTLGAACYNVIYADPPWRFEAYSRETGSNRAPEYPTMTLDQIKALTIPAANDCVLFLWATAAMLPQALEVVAAWGFTYKSHCIWVKDRIGTGYWWRNLHELLLVATRGSVPAPPTALRLPSVFHEPIGRHSAKPPGFAEFIEAWFPHSPKLEMFARERRPGWACWGNELEATT
jgi:N6-adenosine-specific RNA methylase IME4